MGQFKPMTKMMTTEPTVELKLKKGGCVTSAAKDMDDYKSMPKAADGGMFSRMRAPIINAAKKAIANKSSAPSKPSMMDRMKSMKANQPGAMGMARKAAQSMPSKMSTQTSPMKPKGLMGNVARQVSNAVKSMPANMPTQTSPMNPKGVMGGMMGMARKAAMANRPGKTMPANMPAMKKGGESKAVHASEMKKMSGLEKELKSHAGKPASKAHKGLKTGGVAMGQGGFKTGGVIKGNAGYAKGGATKKFADGGAVQDDGRAVKMPQGKKKPSAPVAITELSGTFKKGGKVGKFASGGRSSDDEYMEQLVRDKKMDRATQKGYENAPKASRELESAMNPLSMAKEAFDKVKDYFSGSKLPAGSVTKTKESVTVAKKRGGKC